MFNLGVDGRKRNCKVAHMADAPRSDAPHDDAPRDEPPGRAVTRSVELAAAADEVWLAVADPDERALWLDDPDAATRHVRVDEATPGKVTCPLCDGHGEVDESTAEEYTSQFETPTEPS